MKRLKTTDCRDCERMTVPQAIAFIGGGLFVDAVVDLRYVHPSALPA
jgi:hypothetical protein